MLHPSRCARTRRAQLARLRPYATAQQPGGVPQREALQHIQEVAHLVLEELREDDVALPSSLETAAEPTTTVTVSLPE